MKTEQEVLGMAWKVKDELERAERVARAYLMNNERDLFELWDRSCQVLRARHITLLEVLE